MSGKAHDAHSHGLPPFAKNAKRVGQPAAQQFQAAFLVWGCARPICPARTFATNREVASPTSFGESSCKKCAPSTVTSCWFGQVRQNSLCAPIKNPAGSALMNSFGMRLVDIQRAYESTTSTTSLGSPSIGKSLDQASIGIRERPGILQ